MRVHSTRIVSLLALLLGGCSSRNVTGLSKYHVGYIPDRVYRLKVDRELIHAEWDDEDVHGLAAPGTFKGDATEWLELVGTVPAGTRIRIDELRYETYVTLSDVDRMVTAYGCILDPPHAGKRVSMGGVSEYEDFPAAPLRSTVGKPKPALLEAVVE